MFARRIEPEIELFLPLSPSYSPIKKRKEGGIKKTKMAWQVVWKKKEKNLQTLSKRSTLFFLLFKPTLPMLKKNLYWIPTTQKKKKKLSMLDANDLQVANHAQKSHFSLSNVIAELSAALCCFWQITIRYSPASYLLVLSHAGAEAEKLPQRCRIRRHNLVW